MNNETVLGTGKISSLIFKMGIPSLVAQLINMLYNIVDRIYIGHIENIGRLALTGVGLAMPIITIITAFSSFAGMGGSPLAGISLGKGDKKHAEKIMGNAFFMLIVFSIVLTVVFSIFKEPILYFIGASDDTIIYASSYLQIYLIGTIFVQISVGLNTFITAQGNAKVAMLSVLIGAIANIILDPIFIFVFKMGVEGAALATIMSQAMSAAWVLWFLFSKKASMRLNLSNVKPNLKIIGAIAALGISPFIMQATESLISIVMSSGLQRYGDDLYVGSLTILQSVMMLVSMPMHGFTQGVAPIISYNYGAGNSARVKETFRKMFIITGSATLVISLSAIIFPSIYTRIFTDDTALIELVSKVLPIFMAGMTIFGIQTSCQTTFMALGQAKLSLFMAMLRKVILLVPLALILPAVTQNVMGIYYAEPISDAISAITCGTVFLCVFGKILANNSKNSDPTMASQQTEG